MYQYGNRKGGRAVPQSAPLRGDQVRNSAGGYAWAIGDWERLQRFLVIGSESGTYYATAQALTAENAQTLIRCLDADYGRALGLIVEMSESGRIPKPDVAVFALAVAASHQNAVVRKAALELLPRVCRTATHLFHFAQYCENLRGWGRSLRKAVAGWYNTKSVDELAYQMVKYRQRDGWTHRDVLRLAHVQPVDGGHNTLYFWAAKGAWIGDNAPMPRYVEGFLKVQALAENADAAASVIRDYDLTWEMVPTELLRYAGVWEALLPNLPATALLRNLGVMAKAGLLVEGSEAAAYVCGRLADKDWLRRSRLHPLAILLAARTFGQGHGVRGGGEWRPVPSVVDALDSAFYAAFGNVQATGKRLLLAVDVSGSMGYTYAANSVLTCREAAAAMAMVAIRVEAEPYVLGFSHELVPLQLRKDMRLGEVVRYMERIPMGGTDCALPMPWALRKNAEVDGFVIYTDNETWYGDIHPAEALRRYREAHVADARLAVVAFTSAMHSIADPLDGGMLDFVGFDTALPEVLTAFLRGEV